MRLRKLVADYPADRRQSMVKLQIVLVYVAGIHSEVMFVEVYFESIVAR
jgi:hypothetical protein